MIDPAPAPLPLDFLAEPAFVLDGAGTVLLANAAARALLGSDPTGQPLGAIADEGEPGEVAALLRRASGSTAPMPAALVLRIPGGAHRVKLHAARLPGPEPRVVLRGVAAAEDRFEVLSRRVRELDAQLRQRLLEKEELERALTANRSLLRELQHRVINNIQMVITLIGLSARRLDTPETTELATVARLRLLAMAASQEALYRSTRPGRVAAGPMIEDVVGAVATTAAPGQQIDREIAEVEVSDEYVHCLAIIANELVANAVRHGGDRIAVRFREEGGEIVLKVSDDGPGLQPDAASARSGLGLVESLCRQIGGRLVIAEGPGTSCEVHFRDSTGAGTP